MAVRVAVELNLFEHVAEASKSGKPITAAQLASKTGAEELLIGKWFLCSAKRYTFVA